MIDEIKYEFNVIQKILLSVEKKEIEVECPNIKNHSFDGICTICFGTKIITIKPKEEKK